MSFTVNVFGETRTFDKKIALLELLQGVEDPDRYICAMVNNRVRELTYELYYDAEVEFLDLTSHEAVRIYESSLRYVVAMAFNRCYPDLHIRFSYNVSRCISVSLLTPGYQATMAMYLRVKHEIESIIEQDLPFVRRIVPNEKAREIYEERGFADKTAILEYRPEKTVHLYECDGYLDYNYQRMVPSSRYIRLYKMKLYAPGFLIQYPRSECGGQIPEFKDAPTFGRVLKESHDWHKTVGLETVAAVNNAIRESGPIEFINICEARHNRQLTELGQLIEDDIEDIRLICIAGPSSSGKTTFANRLRIELLSRGIHPIRVSIDDYYKSREEMPVDENGEQDFEAITALKIDEFNQDMFDLIAGKEVVLPRFDFQIGHAVPGRKVKIGPNQPIIIEGIHALNEDLTPSIPKANKFKIFISPMAQMNLDDHNPMSLTDLRLIRRIVRDKKFRGADAIETLQMWPGVRQGEFKWIYDTQEGSDYVFNSFLTYELPIMRKMAMPLLQKIEQTSPYFPDAERLLRLLKFFIDLPEEWVPNNSLMREFIGGSCYADV